MTVVTSVMARTGLCAFIFLCPLKGRRAENWAREEVSGDPRQPAWLCCMGSVALRESWLIDMASWLLSWSSRGVVLFLATVQKQGEHVPRQTLALQCRCSPNPRSGGSRDSCPKTRVSVSKLSSACGVHAYWDVYIEYFSLQIFEIKYIFHLHYEKSIYRNQIKLAI